MPRIHWGILSVSLFVSAILALAFVKIALLLGLKEQLNYVVPLLPVFYACVFPLLEKTFSTPKFKASYNLLEPYRDTKRWSGKLNVILAAAVASLVIETLMDLAAWATYRHFALGLPISSAHANASAALRLFQGNLIPVEGIWRFTYLWFEMIIASLCGGFCAGFFSRQNPLMNGVLAGVIVSMWTGAHQFSFVYEELSFTFFQISTAFGRHPFNGMVVGPFLQVFLFALSSGFAYKLRTSSKAITILMPRSSKRRSQA